MGPAIIGALGAIGAGVAGGLINSGVNNQNLAYQKENLDYQKALQQKIFEREDTAIQRRKNDLIKAGFNPYVSMNGNGAGSGAVVSTTPQHSSFDSSPIQNAISQAPGAFVDMARSLEALKQDKLNTAYMKMDNISKGFDLTDYKYWLINNYGYYDDDGWFKVMTFDPFKSDFGMSPDIFRKYKNSSLAWNNREADYLNADLSRDTYTYRLKMAKFDALTAEYNSEIAKVKRDFAVSDKIEQYILDSISAFTSGSNSARGWYNSYKAAHTLPKAQNYRESYTRNR